MKTKKRKKELIIKTILGLLCTILAFGDGLSQIEIRPSGTNIVSQQIKILDQKELSYTKISGIKFAEASDLAYDANSSKLYMIGDEGMLYVFETKLSDKIDSLNPLYARHLSRGNGEWLKGKHGDSEGMDIDKNGDLIISFEKIPRVINFDKNGTTKLSHKLPQSLINIDRYRSKNKALESVLLHSKYGIITAPERPLKGYKGRQKRIYSLDGKTWDYITDNIPHNSITAIEELDDGNLLILERAKSGRLSPITITLRKLYLDQKEGTNYKTEILAMMKSRDGWSLDNFEGLTKVGKNRFLMVSDDNGSIFQKSILVYFKVIP